MHGTSFHSKRRTPNRGTAAASGATPVSVRRASGPWTAITARVAVMSSPPTAATTRAVLDAFGITWNSPSPTHHTMMSSSTDASASSSRWVYCARPGAILARSLVSARWSASSACGPSTRTVPRWLTSNATAAARHARCSARVPSVYDSGISHPAKSVMRAPSARCSASRGECRDVIGRAYALREGWVGGLPRRRVRSVEPEREGFDSVVDRKVLRRRLEPVLDQQGEVVALVEDLHLDLGVELEQPAH